MRFVFVANQRRFPRLTGPQQTNVKGIVICVQAFLPSRKPSASIIGINAGMINIAVDAGPAIGHSAYTSSKIAQVKVLEYLAAEVPDAFIASVHPGIVETDIMKDFEPEATNSGTENGSPSVPIDDGEYAGFLTHYSAINRRVYHYTDGL